ncbi:MAG: hypothetical protein ACQEXJ_10610 [Myxococcota bacterium]
MVRVAQRRGHFVLSSRDTPPRRVASTGVEMAAGRAWLVGLLVLQVLLAGCRDDGPAEADSPSEAPPATVSDRDAGVFLEAPGSRWTLWGREGARARDPEAVAGLTDGQGCVGLVRVREIGPDVRLADAARARVEALRREGDRLNRFDRVPYVGETAVRFALSGQRDGRRWGTRATLVVVTPEGGPPRLYEVRAESDAPAHVMARRCFDSVTAAFDAWR